MARRYFSSTFAATTLASGVGSSDLTITVAAMSGAPSSTPWTGVIDRGTASEELVEVTAVSSTTLTITRGIDGSTASSHSAGATFEHVVSARDFDEANDHVNKTGGADDPHPQYVLKTATTTPTGALQPYAGGAAPAGWLLCDGTAVSRTTYADLFAVVGTTYGAGNGSTTFNLPDARNRALVGAGSSYSLGTTGGAATVTLTEAQIPGHTHSGTTNTTGAHTHFYEQPIQAAAQRESGTTANGIVIGGANTDSQGSHSHTITTGATGGGGSHENMPPFLAVNMIIKT